MKRDRKGIDLWFGTLYFSHLEFSQMGYVEHMKRAFRFSWLCFVSCIKAFVHGICPCFFEDTASKFKDWV